MVLPRCGLALLLLASAAMASDVAPAASILTPAAKSEAWWSRHHDLYRQQAATAHPRVAFFGDSITQQWTGPGTELWKRDLVPRGAANFGIGGDTIQNIHWRLANGELAGMEPAVVVLMAGTNNLWNASFSVEDLAAGVGACVATIHARQPKAKILLMGVLPAGRDAQNPVRPRVRAINALLAGLAPATVDAFLDLGPQLLAEDGTFPDRLSADHVHLTAEGYGVWSAALLPVLDGLLAAAPGK